MTKKPSYEELEKRVQELEQVEKKAIRNEQRFQFLINSTSSIFWTTDALGAFIDPQPSWENFTGQAWNEHRGFGWTKMIHPDDVDRVLKVWRKASHSLSVYETQERIWNARLQQFRDFEVRAVPIMDSDGSLLEWAGLMTDVTERNSAVNTLKISEKKFSKVFHQAPMMMAISDLSTGTFLDINQNHLDVSGYSRE